jgi:hypothetical protein
MAQNDEYDTLPDAVATDSDQNITQTDNSGDITLPLAPQDPNYEPVDYSGSDDGVDVDEVEL